MKTILIKNGIIVDGSGRDSYAADIFIEDNTIKKIGNIQKNNDYDSVLDANGAYITPGFIDMHSHVDLVNFLAGEMKPKIMQGITTEVIGQCGIGVAPLPAALRDSWRKNLIIGNPAINWDWETTGDFLNSLKKNGVESNIVPFTGHGVLRYAVREDKSGKLNKQEIVKIREYTEEAFEAGIFGLSFGFIYIPALFSDQREIETVLDVASENRGLIAVHLRSEGDELLEALKEMINYTENRECKLHISHLKAIGKRNWSKIDKALQLIDDYDLSFDHYPYYAGSTTLIAIFPPFVVTGDGMEETIKKLKDNNIRKRIKNIFAGKEKMEKGLPWDNIPYLVGWENIRIIDVNSKENSDVIGKNMVEIAEMRNTTPADAAMDLIIEENANVKMIDFYMQDEQLIKIINNDRGMIGTDSLLGGQPHPRVYGTYPRFINKYVLEGGTISMEKAVAKCTSHPAEVLGLKARGLIKEGYKADLVIFDKNFKDTSTFAKPKAYPEGLKYVIINGQLKVEKGKYIEGYHGVILKKR